MKKVISLLFAIVTICVSSSVIMASGVDVSMLNSPAGNIVVDENGTHFVLMDGTMATSKWVKVIDKFMYFDSKGNQAVYNKLNGEITMGADGLAFVNKGYADGILEPISTTDGSMLAEQLAVKILKSQPTSRKRLLSKLNNDSFVIMETGRQSAYTLEEAEEAVDKRLNVDWATMAFKSGTMYYLENEVKPNRDSLQGGDIYEYLLGQGFLKSQADKAADKVLEYIYDIEETGKEKKGYETNQDGNYINGLFN